MVKGMLWLESTVQQCFASSARTMSIHVHPYLSYFFAHPAIISHFFTTNVYMYVYFHLFVPSRTLAFHIKLHPIHENTHGSHKHSKHYQTQELAMTVDLSTSFCLFPVLHFLIYGKQNSSTVSPGKSYSPKFWGLSHTYIMNAHTKAMKPPWWIGYLIRLKQFRIGDLLLTKMGGSKWDYVLPFFVLQL